jgi:hypothetical protein
VDAFFVGVEWVEAGKECHVTRRVVDLAGGAAMVVTDLHGDWQAYEAYRDRFLKLREQGAVDRLILCGDLIHGTGPAHEDASLNMVLDVIALQESVGPDVVTMLLGNHEIPHLYSFPLSRGAVDYTPRFEAALSTAGAATRARVLSFFDGLPFYVRTAAGVMISHCGAAALAAMPGNRDRLIAFSHREAIARVDAALAQEDAGLLRQEYEQMARLDYDEAARYYLAVSGPDDPRYNELLRNLLLNRSNPDFSLVWDTFFTRNERETALVSGHIPVLGGYELVCQRQLRLASFAHANPHDAGLYLRLDCAVPVQEPGDLADCLESVWTA